jgi:hypothetical protein
MYFCCPLNHLTPRHIVLLPKHPALFSSSQSFPDLLIKSSRLVSVIHVSPANYSSKRALKEDSRVAKCPSIALQLAGTKKYGRCSRAEVCIFRGFLAASEGTNAVRNISMNMWLTLRRARELVLKPWHEGGGNTIYRRNTTQFVVQMPQQRRAAS